MLAKYTIIDCYSKDYPLRFDFSESRVAQTNKSTNVMHNSPTPTSRPASTRFDGKENMEPEHMDERFMSATADVFTRQHFFNNSLNPLFYHSHAHAFTYGDRTAQHAEGQAGSSSFGGDFKPVMTLNSIRGLTHVHGLPANSGRGTGVFIPFGV